MSSSADASAERPNGVFSVAPLASVARIADIEKHRAHLARIAERAVHRALYDQPVDDSRKLTGDAFTLLQHIYVAAASAATETSGAVVWVTSKQLKAALRRLPGDRGEVTDGTVRPFMTYWRKCFKRHGAKRPGGLASGVITVKNVRVGRRSYTVHLHMRYADQATTYYWLDIEDSRGREVLVTPFGKLEESAVELGHVLDSELYKRVIRNPRVLDALRDYFEKHPAARRVLALIGVLAAMHLHPAVRSEAKELVLRAVRWVREAISAPAPVVEPHVRPSVPRSTPASPPLGPSEPTPVSTTSAGLDFSMPLITQSGLAAVARSIVPPSEPGADPVINEEQLRAVAYRLISYDPAASTYRESQLGPEGLEPHAWNMRANVVAHSGSTVQVSLRPSLRGTDWAMEPPTIVKWAVFAIDPTGNLLPVARPLGKQVFVNLDPLATHAVLMVAESEQYDSPRMSGNGCAMQRQGYELGLGLLPPLSGAAVGADDILRFRQQDMDWKTAIYPAWDSANPRLARFLLMLPKIDPETDELIIHYGDGISQDRDFISMGGSRYSSAWYVEHHYAEPGPKTVRLEVLKKRIGAHPNHPAGLSVTERLVVQ